ncbi:MAG: hypothetical protein M1142_05535 [Patescibacteria group bacterium]|nr:hypothetical protein [Patescibacteria group bacterium]
MKERTYGSLWDEISYNLRKADLMAERRELFDLIAGARVAAILGMVGLGAGTAFNRYKENKVARFVSRASFAGGALLAVTGLMGEVFCRKVDGLIQQEQARRREIR